MYGLLYISIDLKYIYVLKLKEKKMEMTLLVPNYA